MAEDEETATARYIAANISNQLMLKVLFELVGQIVSDDPDTFREKVKRQLLDTAAAIPMGPMDVSREKKVRQFVQENVGTLLTNKRLN
jgi:hypothetical protein